MIQRYRHGMAKAKKQAALHPVGGTECTQPESPDPVKSSQLHEDITALEAASQLHRFKQKAVELAQQLSLAEHAAEAKNQQQTQQIAQLISELSSAKESQSMLAAKAAHEESLRTAAQLSLPDSLAEAKAAAKKVAAFDAAATELAQQLSITEQQLQSQQTQHDAQIEQLKTDYQNALSELTAQQLASAEHALMASGSAVVDAEAQLIELQAALCTVQAVNVQKDAALTSTRTELELVLADVQRHKSLLSIEEVNLVNKLFVGLDEDINGSLDLQELSLIYSKQQALVSFFDGIDQADVQAVSIEEFVAYFGRLKQHKGSKTVGFVLEHWSSQVKETVELKAGEQAVAAAKKEAEANKIMTTLQNSATELADQLAAKETEAKLAHAQQGKQITKLKAEYQKVLNELTAQIAEDTELAVQLAAAEQANVFLHHQKNEEISQLKAEFESTLDKQRAELTQNLSAAEEEIRCTLQEEADKATQKLLEGEQLIQSDLKMQAAAADKRNADLEAELAKLRDALSDAEKELARAEGLNQGLILASPAKGADTNGNGALEKSLAAEQEIVQLKTDYQNMIDQQASELATKLSAAEKDYQNGLNEQAAELARQLSEAELHYQVTLTHQAAAVEAEKREYHDQIAAQLATDYRSSLNQGSSQIIAELDEAHQSISALTRQVQVCLLKWCLLLTNCLMVRMLSWKCSMPMKMRRRQEIDCKSTQCVTQMLVACC